MEQKIIKIATLTKTSLGFHIIHISKNLADALLRGQSTNVIVSLADNIQKGDFIVFDVFAIYTEPSITFHPIKDKVWVVSFVSNIPNSTLGNGYGQAALSISQVVGATYHYGDISGEYRDECIVFKN